MSEDTKGCLTAVAVIVVFILAGNLLTLIIKRADNVIAWIIMAAIFIPLIGFIIGIIRGIKKEEEEDD